MKNIFITLFIFIHLPSIGYSQHTLEEFYVHNGENIFYLDMPASEVRRIMGVPIEEEIIFGEGFRPNYFIIKYPDIEFSFPDFSHKLELIPTIIMIRFNNNYLISNQSVIGRHKEDIIKHYGNPEPYTIRIYNECTYFSYNYLIQSPSHVNIQFEFNINGICTEIILTHSDLFI